MEQVASGMSNSGTSPFEGGSEHGHEMPKKGLSSYNDELLMKRMKDGDKEAFEVLVARHVDVVTALSTRLFADPEVGRGVAKEVFLDLWKDRHRFTGDLFLHQNLLRLTFEKCKERKHHYIAVDRVSGQSESPLGMQGALERLDLAEREILVMRFGMDMAYPDISRETGKPIDHLRTQIFDSLRKLRGFMETDKNMEGAS